MISPAIFGSSLEADIEALRQKVLDAAVHGELCEHRAEDGSAADLLKEIAAKKQELIRMGRLKKEKPLPEITEEEEHFEIPENWEWVRLGEVINLLSGRDLSKCDFNSEKKGVAYLTGASNINANGTLVINRWTMNPEVLAQKGDVLLSCKGTVGKTLILNISEAHIARQFMALRPVFILNRYLMYFILHYVDVLKKEAKSMIPGIERDDIILVAFPLPPLAEQQRIVERVDVIFHQLDELKVLQTAYASNLEALRKKVIEEGVRGNLTERLLVDGTAAELLKDIAAEKKELVAAGRMKRGGAPTPVNEDDLPFEIPGSWEWVKLESITYPVGNKNNQILTSRILKEGVIPVVSQGKLFIDGYTNDADKKISDVPVIMFGDHTRNVKYIDFEFVIGADGTKFFKPILIDAKYLYYLITFASSKINNRGYARHFSLLKNYPLPLPPLAEQKRIVAKVDELMKIIDEM